MSDKIATQELKSSSAKKVNIATLSCVASNKKTYSMGKKALTRVDNSPCEKVENATQGAQKQSKKEKKIF